MLNLFYVIPGRLHVLELIPSVLFISIVVFVAKLEKGMTGGKVKFRSEERITTLGRLILNGMQLRFMVSRIRGKVPLTLSHQIVKTFSLSFLFAFSVGSSHPLWRGSNKKG
jgi:hypothetical protein